mmetsp:Transcript_77734/g.237858  ORF Transcript_77734/g.237858 Transcript_77734/m.237858 type:complete len:375 (-) Transcript_77734:44-1168(-)
MFLALADQAELTVENVDDFLSWVLGNLELLAGDLFCDVCVRFRNLHQNRLGQSIVPGQCLALFHAVLVQQNVWIWEVPEQQLPEALLGLLDDLARISEGRPIPNPRGVWGADFIHVDQLLLAALICDVAKLEFRVNENLVQLRQCRTDDVKPLFEQLLVLGNVVRARKVECLEVLFNVRPRYVDVVHLRYALDALEDALGRWGDQQVGQLLVVLQAVRELQAAEFAVALAVGAPHGACDVLTADRLDHHRASLLHDPDQGVRDVEDVAVSQALLPEQFEPMVGNGVESCTLARNPVQAILTVPDAVEGGNAIADDHDGELRTRSHIVAFFLDQAEAVLLGQPIHSSHFAEVHRHVRTDGQVGVDLQDPWHTEPK